MVKRRTCLYNGELIGIESIYTVIDGKQIYKPGVVERLRKLGRQNLLFCSCGCGANLVVVAGDRQLRAQHFKIKTGTGNNICTALEEDDTTIYSKIILKCWLDDKLKSEQIQCRVPLNKVCDSDRKFEFTCFDFSRNLGICYWNRRGNIDSVKVDMIDDNSLEYKALYITDIHNAGSFEQYPEFMLKVQKRQGYNLYLDLNGDNTYEQACLSVRVYVENWFGTWEELDVINGELSEFTFSNESDLLFMNVPVSDMINCEIAEYNKIQEEKRRLAAEKRERERIEEERRRREYEEKARLEAERQEQLRLEEEQRRKQLEEIRLKREKELEEKRAIKAAQANEWIERYKQESRARFNQAVNAKKAEKIELDESVNRKKAVIYCQRCGSVMKQRRGCNGPFWGCSNYPDCTFTESIK